jgi:hypothetical protein
MKYLTDRKIRAILAKHFGKNATMRDLEGMEALRDISRTASDDTAKRILRWAWENASADSYDRLTEWLKKSQ